MTTSLTSRDREAYLVRRSELATQLNALVVIDPDDTSRAHTKNKAHNVFVNGERVHWATDYTDAVSWLGAFLDGWLAHYDFTHSPIRGSIHCH